MKKIILGIMLFGFSAHVMASCETAYVEKIKNIEARMNPARGVLISNSAGAVIAQAVIYSAVGSISVAAAVGVPAIAVAAGGYYSYLVVQKAQLRTASHVIRDAKKGSGKTLDSFIKKLNRRSEVEIDREAVIEVILAGNAANDFCIQNEKTDKFKLFRPLKMAKFVEERLAL